MFSVCLPAFAQTGQNFGEVVGKVVDDQGGVLPGVTVTLSGPATMGTPTAVTNERGQYRFPAVNSGTYKLSFDLPGFATYVREGVVVAVRSTVTIDAELKLAGLQETVTVSGASPTVDVENTKVGARLDKTTLEEVPTQRTIFGAATVLPGMTMSRQDVGGLNSATSTGMTAHGAANYNLNYFGVTADTPQNYGSMYYMDYGSAEEVSVDTAAMGAEIGGGGGANINIIPKSGGNDIKGNAYFTTTNKDLANSNITDELRAIGVTSSSALDSLRDFNADAGGPFIKDKLWWFGSFREYTTHENIPRFPIKFKSNLRNYTARLNFQATKNNTLSGFWTYNRKFQPNRGAGGSQPDPVTTLNQQSPKNLYNVTWNSVLGQNSFLEVSSSYFHMHWPSKYSDAFYAQDTLTSPMADITTGVFSGADPTGERLRDSYRYQTNVGLTQYFDGFLGGSHQLKSGIENWYGWGTDGFNVQNDTMLRFRNGVPAEIWAYTTPLTQETKMKNFAAFVQDRITYNRLTVNLGLRYAHYDGEVPEQEGGGGRWFPDVIYPKVDPGFSWNSIAPRTGIVLKLDENGRSVVKASYGQYYEHMYTTIFSDVINPNVIRSSATSGGNATYRWFGDANSNGVVDEGEYDPNPLSVFVPRNNSISPDFKDPRTDEITFGYQRELTPNVGFSAQWIQRWYTDNYADVNVGIPTAAYTPRNLTDAGPDNFIGTSDDRQVTLFDVAPEFVGQDAFRRETVDGTARYRGLELSVTKRMSNRWQMMGSYVWSRADGVIMFGDGRQVSDPTNPNLMLESNNKGRQSTDQPHAFKLIGSYLAPWGITLGANYQALSGLPVDRQFRAALAQGSTTIRADQRGDHRADFLNLLSLRADKKFNLHQHARVSAIVEVHNALNSHAGQNSYGLLTQSFRTQADLDRANAGTTAYFGRIQEILAPRIFKFGLRFEF